MPGITEIPNTPALDALLFSLPPGAVAVLDFHATWCGPCKFIAPVLERMATSYPDVAFVKIDVDVCKELALRYRVSAMPTFKVLKKGESEAAVVDTLRGADAKALVAMVAKHSGRDVASPKAGEEVKLDDLAPAPTISPVLRFAMFAMLGWVLFNWLSKK